MKHWQETASILDRIASLDARSRAALATVVRVTGSAYRRPGAKLLVDPSGSTFGGVSGGCLEADVREIALEVIRSQAPHLRHYETGADDSIVWGLGLGCEGAIDVFVQPVVRTPESDVYRRMSELIEARSAFAVATVVDGPAAGGALVWVPPPGARAGSTGEEALDREISREAATLLGRGESGLVEVGSRRVFVDALSPPPSFALFGAGDDALPLARLALEAGFDVMVVDHRPAALAPERFPPAIRRVLRRSSDGVAGLWPGGGRDRLAVVLTHSLEHDREWVRALLREPLTYIGLLGPRTRKASILRELGHDPPPQLFAPVGLDVGADGPEQVAIAIVAEALAVHAGRRPDHLRAREAGIHAR